MDAKTYIERYQDEYGNIGYIVNQQPVVIQAVQDGHTLTVIALPEFVEKWPTVAIWYFVEVEAEPGIITWERHRELMGGVEGK